MKTNNLIFAFLLTGLLAHAQINRVEGLWKVVDHVFDGSVNRLDNLIIEMNGETIDFLFQDSITAKGILSNDTIYVLSGFECYDIDWIEIVNNDSLVSSTPNLECSNNLSFNRIDLTGDWEQIIYEWEGNIRRDTCEVIQEKDTIYFYQSTDCFATAYVRKDSIIITEGFEGIGIDYFSMYSNDQFDKITPLIESIDSVLFLRLGQTLGIVSKPDVSIQVFPNPTDGFVRIGLLNNRIKRIGLYSLMGETLLNQQHDQQSVDLNLSDLMNGFYILEIESNDNKVIKQKILKE